MKKIMILDFLQIGFNKTGTTFLEKNVYPLNKKINCIQAAKYKKLDKLLLNKLILPDGLEYNELEFKNEFNNVINNLFKENKVNGIMFEPFTFLYEKRFDRRVVLNRLKTLFPDIKIILFIRNQVSWLRSHYSQSVKSGCYLNIHDFVECIMNSNILIRDYIDWYLLVKYLYELFGKENVLICLYEELKKDSQKLADKIFDFLGVETCKIDTSRVNKSLSKYSLNIMRFFNHFFRYDCGVSGYSFFYETKWGEFGNSKLSKLSRWRYKLIYCYYKPRMINWLYKLDELFNWKKKIEISETHKNLIKDYYAENNRKLAELLDVNLKKFGYIF